MKPPGAPLWKEPRRSFAERVAFATVWIWSAHVLFVFFWLLLPGAAADRYVNSLSLIRVYDASGVFTSLWRAAVGSSCLGIPLGISGAMSAHLALQSAADPGRIALALSLNIGIAGVVPVLGLVL